MNIENLKVEEIIPYENNPRNNDAAVPAVAESIKQFGFKVPIVIDKNKVIVCGHTRLKAAIKLGMTEVPCVVADDLSEEQIKAFRLADNKVSELATWNEEMLKIEIDDIKSIDLEDFGFDLDSYEEPVQVEEDDYDFSSEVEPKAKKGDIFQLGNHRLMCGDSTDIEDVELLMNGDKANLLITDPPYNVNYEGGTDDI